MDTGIFKKLRAAYNAQEINYQELPLLTPDLLEEGWLAVPPSNNPPIEGQPISFVHEGNPNMYIDFNASYAEFRVKLVKESGEVIAGGDDVATVNMAAHAMFRSCITQIQGQEVSPTDYHYAHRQNIAHQITHTRDMNKYHSKVFEGWESDAPVEQFATVGDANTGYLARKGTFSDSKLVTFIIHPCDGIWQQGFDLPPRFDLKLTFERTTNAFVTMEKLANLTDASKNYKLKIEFALLHLKYKIIDPKKYQEHRDLLASPNGMVFHLKNAQMKLNSIPKECSTHTIQGMYNGILPPMIVLAMVNSEAFNGTVRTNPFYYRPFDVESIEFRVNSKTINGKVIRPDFGTKKLYLREYYQFLDTTCFTDKEVLDISLEQWAASSNFWVFETTPFAAQLDVLQAVGGIDLEIRFSTTTKAPITLISLGQNYETVRLRDNRSVEYFRNVA